jgi:hypothetical protein
MYCVFQQADEALNGAKKGSAPLENVMKKIILSVYGLSMP